MHIHTTPPLLEDTSTKYSRQSIRHFLKSIDATPFELLVGVKMKTKEDRKIRDIINKETLALFNDDLTELRAKAKTQILKIQNENKNTYNMRRRHARR